MATFILRSTAPSVGAGDATPIDCGANGSTVTNSGSVTCYYNDELPVTTSSTSLAAGASVQLTGSQYFQVFASTTVQSTVLQVDPAVAVTPWQVTDGFTFPFRNTDVTDDIKTMTSTGSNTTLFADGRGNGVPCYSTRSLTLKFGVSVAVAVGSTTFELYGATDDVTNNRPGTLTPLGTVDSSTTGEKYVTTNYYVTRGQRFWIIVISRGGTPTLRGGLAGAWQLHVPTASFVATGMYTWRYTGTIGAGASGTAPVPTAIDSTIPLILAKVA